MAGRKTLETLSAADAIVDALDVARHERERIDAHVESRARKAASGEEEREEAEAAKRARDADDDERLRKLFAGDEGEADAGESDSDDDADAIVVSGGAYGSNPAYPKGLVPNPLLMGRSPERYALAAIEKVRSADLEQAVLSLPFSSALALLEYLAGWLEAGERTELTCRLASLIVRLHYVQLGATAAARGVLLETSAAPSTTSGGVSRRRRVQRRGFEHVGESHQRRTARRRRRRGGGGGG